MVPVSLAVLCWHWAGQMKVYNSKRATHCKTETGRDIVPPSCQSVVCGNSTFQKNKIKPLIMEKAKGVKRESGRNQSKTKKELTEQHRLNVKCLGVVWKSVPPLNLCLLLPPGLERVHSFHEISKWQDLINYKNINTTRCLFCHCNETRGCRSYWNSCGCFSSGQYPVQYPKLIQSVCELHLNIYYT